MSPSGYGIYFGLVALGYMFGNYLSGRFSRMVGTTKMMMSGCLIVVAGIAFSIVLFNTGYIHPLSLFLPAGIIGIGNGMTLPNATAGMVSIRPRLAGAASGLGGTLQLGGGALMALLAAAVLNADSGPNPLLYVMMLSAVLAVATAAYVILVDWQMQDT